MSENKHTLDNLLALAKQQAPLLTREQVHEFVNKAPVKAFPGKQLVNLFKNNLNLIIMSTIVSSIIIGMLLRVNVTKLNVSQKEDIINPAKSQSTNTITASPKSHYSNTIAALPKSKDSKAKPKNLLEKPKIEDSTQANNQNAPIIGNSASIGADSASKEQIISFNAAIINPQEHHWPVDTVLDGKSFYVNLTDGELMKLGINVTKDAILYCNKNSYGSCNTFTWALTSGKKAKIFDTTYFSFVGRFTSELNFDENIHNNLKEYSMMDTLLPIILFNKLTSRKQIFWFSTNDELFKALPERYKYLEIKYKELKLLKNTNPNKIYVNYFNLEENLKRLQNVNFIELTDKELENFGYEIINDTTTYEKSDYENIFDDKRNKKNIPLQIPNNSTTFKNGDTVFRKIFKLRTNKKDYKNVIYASYLIRRDYRSLSYFPAYVNNFFKTEHPYPKVITDSLGRFSFSNEKLRNTDFSTLIPIKINFSKYEFQPKFGPDSEKRVYIFWYEPDTAFINRLPKSIASVLKPEYDAIVKSGGTSSQSCTYFEVCQSTLTLNRLDVYPNPAKQKVTIDFNAPEDLTGSISLVDIRGSEVKVLLPTTRFVKGENKFSADLSGINPGIYLIYINTNKGFRTQRMVVTK